ncbi:hypothetical protein TrispH2_008131 [Trichoplax sp. H2]|nr:hypothetical protein TrispH2_008131 [Trichoplax sp. H2]|eukprot:RDD39154.1 hypothetical protein TrispH2_008131 [Trichoplax sp. H2]
MSIWFSIAILSVLVPFVQLTPIRPRSCLQAKELVAQRNGYYVLFDSTNKPFMTYCDFESDKGFAWTLVESLSLVKAKTSKYQKNFYYDEESDVCTVNWAEYRLSKSKMLSIYQTPGSDYVRATCNFNAGIDGGLIDHRDYFRVATCRYNIFTISNSFGCISLDYFNVRGYSCRKCSVPVYYGRSNYHTFIDVSRATQSCSRLKIPETINNEEAFGRYRTVNPKFRCSTNSTSTTNWWFGGTVIA